MIPDDVLDEMVKNVDYGARRLDRFEPGWWRQIDLGTLELDSTRSCICGQLFSARAETYCEDGFEYVVAGRHRSFTGNPEHYGFDAPDAYDGAGSLMAMYRALDGLWTLAIKDRFENDTLA